MQVELVNNATMQTVSEPPDSQESGGCDEVTFSTGLSFNTNDSQTNVNCPECEDTSTLDDLDYPPAIDSCPWYVDDMPAALDLDEPYPSLNVVNIQLSHHINGSQSNFLAIVRLWIPTMHSPNLAHLRGSLGSQPALESGPACSVPLDAHIQDYHIRGEMWILLVSVKTTRRD